MQADMALLNRLVAASLPELANHLEAIALPLDLFATQWLVSLFSASLPPQVSKIGVDLDRLIRVSELSSCSFLSPLFNFYTYIVSLKYCRICSPFCFASYVPSFCVLSLFFSNVCRPQCACGIGCFWTAQRSSCQWPWRCSDEPNRNSAKPKTSRDVLR